MIELTLISYLNDALDGIPVYAEEPEKPPKQYILVENQGTSRSNFLYSSLVAFQAYGETMLECLQMTEALCDAVDEMTSLDLITRVELNSRYPFNDPTTKRYRYQIVYDIYHYE